MIQSAAMMERRMGIPAFLPARMWGKLIRENAIRHHLQIHQVLGGRDGI